jgi:disulfide oxidoreductase YuzD
MRRMRMDKGDYIKAVILNEELIAFPGRVMESAEFVTIKADITHSDYHKFTKRILDDNFFVGKVVAGDDSIHEGQLMINSLEHDSHYNQSGEFLFAKDLKSCIERGQTIERNK